SAGAETPLPAGPFGGRAAAGAVRGVVRDAGAGSHSRFGPGFAEKPRLSGAFFGALCTARAAAHVHRAAVAPKWLVSLADPLYQAALYHHLRPHLLDGAGAAGRLVHPVGSAGLCRAARYSLLGHRRPLAAAYSTDQHLPFVAPAPRPRTRQGYWRMIARFE